MTIKNLRRHTAQPGAESVGVSLPIVRYHELELHGPFASTIITVVEDGIWRSNIIRMPRHTAAEIVEGLNGTPWRNTMERMKEHQRSHPNGEDFPVPSGFAVCNLG